MPSPAQIILTRLNHNRPANYRMRANEFHHSILNFDITVSLLINSHIAQVADHALIVARGAVVLGGGGGGVRFKFKISGD